MNNEKPIKISNVIAGLGIVLGCAAYAYIKKKSRTEVIDISASQPQEPIEEPRG